ncbi:MAG: hypothetical protein A2V98_23790 [Planctomycetes bacterium RBG_16_64_12]|nr:MAG: hypothetical protein A2V98_23790 [Planctomycetes bacterium RBG_16_64_12]
MSNTLPQPQDLNTTESLEAGGRPGSAQASAVVDRPDSLSRQQAVVAMGRRAIAAPELSILMRDAASLIAEALGAEYGCTAEVVPGSSKIVHTLMLREPDRAKPRVFVHESGTDGRDSLAACAMEVAHPVVVAELSREPRFRDYFLERHGANSAIAVPLALHGHALGALAACTAEIRQFDAEDASFAEAVAHLTATTMGRVRAENALAAERRLAAAVFETVGAIVLVLDTGGRILRVNRACQQVTGFSPGEIQDHPIWSVFAVPKEADSFETTFRKLAKGASSAQCESLLLTKHGDRRRIAWSCKAMPGPEGSTESIIATGIDVTSERQAEEKAAEAERVAESARSAMKRMSSSLSDGAYDYSTWTGTDSQTYSHDEESEKVGGLPGPVARSERRRHPRRSFPYSQWVAPVLGEELPAEEEFQEIECNDISSGGFSFLLPKPPQSDTFVAALGIPPRLTYLTAHITHVTRLERDGQPMYLVGCRYMGRARY